MSALDDALIAAVRLAAGVPTLDVRIENRAGGWRSDDASIQIRNGGIRRVGIDERRFVEVEVDSVRFLREEIHGNRVVTIALFFDTNQHDSVFSSEELADTVIAGFHRSDVGAILDAVNLARPECSEVRTVPTKSTNGDVRSISIVDARFHTSRKVTGALYDPIESVSSSVVLVP
jgi:hypothetical protein